MPSEHQSTGLPMSSTGASGLQIDCSGPCWFYAFLALPSTSHGTPGHSGEMDKYNYDCYGDDE